jgi:hypothetical protein
MSRALIPLLPWRERADRRSMGSGGLAVRSKTRAVASCLGASLALLVLSAPATAKPRPITGKLSKTGYSVLTPARSGGGRVILAHASSDGRFRLTPPAASVTLQLRAPNGDYAGPIVFGRTGKLAIVGVRAGARLGLVKIDVRRGYAKLASRLPRRWLDASRLARARDGVPVGNGRNFGFVRSRAIRASGAASGGAGRDRDADGIPDAFDVAADGDLILNNFRKSQRASAAQNADRAVLYPIESILLLQMEETLNANAAGLGVHDVNEAVRQHSGLMIGILPSDPGTPPELDCGGGPNPSPPPAWVGGFSYCTPGGSGKVLFGALDGQPFPDCCTDPATGFGKLTSWDGTSPAFFLQHGASVAQEDGKPAEIGTGNELIERVMTGGPEGPCSPTGPTCFSSTLQFVFATVPALAAYSDTAGNCAQASGASGSCATQFSYPVAAPTPNCPPPGCPPAGPGTFGNGFPVAAGPNGKVEVALTFWRPQRAPIPPGDNGVGGDACTQDSPPCQWVDIGHLTYTAVLAGAGAPQLFNCPQDSFTPGPNLTPAPLLFGQGGGLADAADDQTASAANTFTYTLDVTGCLASQGLSWDPGQELQFQFTGTNGYDNARQFVSFKRQ